MNELEKIIHRLYLVSDTDAPKLVAELFTKLSNTVKNDDSLVDYLRKEAELIANVVPCWDWLETSLCEILSEPHSEQEIYSNILYSLYKLTKTKIQQHKELEMIICKQAIPYSYDFTNINTNSMGKILREMGQQVDIQLDLPKKQTQTDVFFAIKKIAKEIGAKNPSYGDNDFNCLWCKLEAFAGTVKQYFSRKNRNNWLRKRAEEFSHDFFYCMKCWRLVPKKHFGDGAPPLCDFHNYPSEEPDCSTGYKKALQINNLLMGHRMQMSQKEMDILDRFKKVWRLYVHDDLTREEWDLAFVLENGFKKLLDKSPKPIEYAMEPIWGVCPQTCAYILDNGGDPLNCESVLEILDPFTEYEIRMGDTESREYLHKALCLNFACYRLEIAKAEAWLSTYNKLYGGKTHGGPRKNSGGKRPGAGRPKKKP